MKKSLSRMRVIALAPVLVLVGCSGLLDVAPGNGERVCKSAADCESSELCINSICSFGNNGACWVFNSAGNCPAGLHCIDGVCAKSATAWCHCEPDQGCLNGQCVKLLGEIGCSADRPAGACVEGSVCVGGTCVELTPSNICSTNRLSGLCPSGAACVHGQCRPVAEDPCAPTNTDGLCPSGQRCGTAGVCVSVPCAPATPNGSCPDTGTVCNNGLCVALPCSTMNPTGSCGTPQTFCSATGACIAFGTCASNLDCDTGNYCGASGVCRPAGTCVDAADCGQFSTCDNGSCARDLSCANDSNCPSGEHCLNFPAGGQCGPRYACYDSSDCAVGSYCSVNGQCVTNGQCGANADCVGNRCDVASCKCSSIDTCIASDACATSSDCPIGERCGETTCVPVDACDHTKNHTTCVGDACCAESDHLCSIDDVCIPVGSCREDADCAPGTACAADGTCSKGPTCASDSDCGGGHFCSYYGVCANGARGSDCTTTGDCGAGQICNDLFKCDVAAHCGGTEFSTTRVEPNMLILLDRSSSMNRTTLASGDTYSLGAPECPSESIKRWQTAVTAINAVVTDHADDIRFGLTTFPSNDLCGGPKSCDSNCDNDCEGGWCNVPNPPPGSANGNCEPGYVDEAMGATAAAITADLSGNSPGGNTPTMRALRVIADNPGVYGLPVQGDPVTRDNYILLITDGEPNCEEGGSNCLNICKNAQGTCSSNCLVNTEIDRLAHLSPPIKTFTVGFAFDNIRPNLNCNAVFGGTSRCDPSVTTSTCGSYSAAACYYQANDASSLVTALASISHSVAGCVFDIDQTPPDLERIYVFTRTVGPPLGPSVPVSMNNQTDPAGYYTLVGRRIQLFGQVCDRVQAGEVVPQVIYGCPEPGG